MPVKVVKRGENDYVIVEISSGRVVGHSKSRRDAEISASIRNRTIRSELGLSYNFTKEGIENNIAFFTAFGFNAKKAVDLAFFASKSG